MAEPDRRTRLLEAAADLVASDGLGAVTHRSVEKTTGLPHGSVTYYFSSRDGLIAALVDWMCGQSERQVRAIADELRAQLSRGAAPDLGVLSAALTRWHDNNAAIHLARMELELQGARDRAHAVRMAAASQVFWDICATVAAALGSTEPGRDGRTMAAMLDGILFDRLAHPGQPDEVTATAVRWVLQGVTGAQEG